MSPSRYVLSKFHCKCKVKYIPMHPGGKQVTRMSKGGVCVWGGGGGGIVWINIHTYVNTYTYIHKYVSHIYIYVHITCKRTRYVHTYLHNIIVCRYVGTVTTVYNTTTGSTVCMSRNYKIKNCIVSMAVKIGYFLLCITYQPYGIRTYIRTYVYTCMYVRTCIRTSTCVHIRTYVHTVSTEEFIHLHNNSAFSV